MTKTSRIPRWLKIFWPSLVLVVAAAQVVAYFFDQAAGNVAILLGADLGIVVTYLWLVIAKPYGHRRLLLIGGLVAVAAGISLFRFETLTGGLVPRVVPRWAPAPSTELARVAGGGAVDLRTTSEYDFPGFLGPGRDQVIDNVVLETDWDAHPPQELWRQPIGAGWSGLAIVNGFAATLEQRGDVELVTLYDVESGALRWAHEVAASRYDSAVAGTGPRSTPAIDEGVVYAVSVYGKLLALDGSDGTPIWQRDLREDYGVSMATEVEQLPYGRPSSPLVVGDLVVVPAGGTPATRLVSVAAFDKNDGSLVWEGGSHQISMASPSFAMLGGVEQVLVVNEDFVTGHALADGRQLWEIEWPGKSASNASASQAVPLPPDGVFVSKGYAQGAARFRLARSGPGFQPSLLWHTSRSLRTKFTNVAMKDGYAYGLSEGVLECIELDDGERAWKSGRYGHGQILRVGDVLIVLSEDGELTLVEATPERKNHVLAGIEALNGKTWNHFALSNDRLLVRNAQEMVAYRLPLRDGSH